MSYACWECGDSHRSPMWIVADRPICENCATKIRDVMEMAAALKISVFDLCAAVVK